MIYVFQSTHLHEVWLIHLWKFNTVIVVSIHTPTWGVTVCNTNTFEYMVFQSTHLHEVWHGLSRKRINKQRFQSTHLHEVWPNATSMGVWKRRFQSTHLHEVWPCGKFYFNFTGGFQSTHLHEVWPPGYWASISIRSFNPHTYMRCDPMLDNILSASKFNQLLCESLLLFRFHNPKLLYK